MHDLQESATGSVAIGQRPTVAGRCPRCGAATPASPCASCGRAFDTDAGTTAAEELAGQTPGGYRATGVLAAGGMGLVLRGEDSASGRPVVLKAPRDAGPAAHERFTREARALATCDHPNIVRLLDVDSTASGRPLLVLEHLPGVDLGHLLARGPLPLGLLERLAGDLARALDHLHRRGIVHRDLKPANIVVGPERCALLDFGIAAIDQGIRPRGAAGQLTPAGALLGTPPYCAPEQLIDPRRAGPAADVYAYGMVLRRCLGDHPPAPPLAERWTDWQRLAAACCAEHPDQRPDDGDLLGFINRLPALPRPSAPVAPRARRRLRLPAGALGALAAMAVAATVLSLGWQRPAVTSPDILQGTVPGDGLVTLELPPGAAARIEPLADTRLRLPGTGPWRAAGVWVRADERGLVRLQLSDADGRWQIAVTRR